VIPTATRNSRYPYVWIKNLDSTPPLFASKKTKVFSHARDGKIVGESAEGSSPYENTRGTDLLYLDESYDQTDL
jgi:hypothetical protein